MFPKITRVSPGLSGLCLASSLSPRWLPLSDTQWPPPENLGQMATTVIVAVTAIITGLIRLTLREKSPWKVRSVAFDSFIGIALGIGLLITYFSFYGLLGNAIFG